MKNKLIVLAVVICSFFFVDKVSAMNIELDYSHTKMQKLDEYKYVVDELINIAEQYNTKDFAFFINFGYNSGYQIQIGITGATNEYFEFMPYYSTTSKYLYNDVFLSGNSYGLLHETSHGQAFTEHFEIKLSSINDENLQIFYNKVKNIFSNGSNNRNGLKNQYAMSKPNSNSLDNTTFIVPVFSNVPVKFMQADTRYNDTLQINDTIFNYDEFIFTYYDYAYSSPKTYEFDDIIHDDNIAQTYFDLDLEQLIKKDFNISLKYAYGNYTRDIIAPYLKITYNDNTNAYFSMTTNQSPIVFVYMGDFEMCLTDTENISSVQVVFPMETTNDIDYKIQLESNVKFDISYVYDEVFNSNLTTIDLTGKYALIVIPKTKNENGFLEDFYINGGLEVRGISDIDNISNSSVAIAKCYNNVFRLDTLSTFITGALQFVNDDYKTYPDLKKTVTFNASKFNYYIVNTSNDTVKITNPNTDKTTDLNMYDVNFQLQITESQANTNSMFGVFKIVNNYISSLKDMFDIFIEQIQFLFNGLNSQIRNFIISIFIVIVVCSIIIVIRK